MKKHIQGFSHGINQDISVNKYPNTNYFWAQNMRLISKEGLSTGALTNVGGTIPKITLPTTVNITGTCVIRDKLILFGNEANGGRIYVWNYNNDTTSTEESPTLIYTDPDLDFSNPIKAVGRYETENIQKIYFTDGNSFFKFLNIIPQTGESYPLNDYRNVESLDLVSNVQFSPMSLEVDNGGNLRVGKIQYAYQLYSKRGSESVFSPASQVIHITDYNENQTSAEYHGSEIGTISNKVVNITIENPDDLFTRLRLVAIEYETLYQTPTVRVVGEYSIENLNEITISDIGSSVGELTIEEFRFIQNNFYPKTIDIKDDHLFAANIKNEYFEISDDEFDARAFRANSSDEIKVYDGDTEVSVPHTDGIFDVDDLPDIESEQFNKFNDISNDYDGNTGLDSTGQAAQFKFKPGSSGTTLGGRGVNIQYEFTTETMVLDNTPRGYDFGDGYAKMTIGASAPFDNYANPLTQAGYQRDEIYRFGIVFFDKKGRQSFVKWIGDIRFPSNREFPYVTYDASNNRTLGHILGIKFEVIIPLALQEKISGYQIVRAERTNSDKTIISQGLASYPIYDDFGINSQNGHIYPMATNAVAKDMVNKRTSILRETESYNGISYGDTVERDKARLHSSFIDFTSPEIAINRPKLPISGAFLEIQGYLNNNEFVGTSGVKGFEDPSDDSLDQRDIITADKPRNFSYNENTTKVRAMVNNARIFTPKSRGHTEGQPNNDNTKNVIESNQIYNNQAYLPNPTKDYPQGDHTSNTNAKSKWGLKGTHGLITVEDELPLSSNWYSDGDPIRFLHANYKVDKGRSMYGGSTYEARSYTRYYPVTEFLPKDLDTSFDDTITSSKNIQILNSLGYRVEEDETLRISAVKTFNFYISNYGTDPLTIDSISMSAGDPWVILSDPSGLIVSPGGQAYASIGYTGDDTGISTNAVTINSDADNAPQFDFTLTVDYTDDPIQEDYIGDAQPIPVDTTAEEDESGLKVFNGDTYISFFAYMRSIYDHHQRVNGYRIESYQFFPVESTINLEMRLDPMQKFINWGLYRDTNVIDYKLMETVQQGITAYGNNYPVDVGNLYRYNSVYSVIDKSKEFFPRPFDFESTLINDTRIIASEKKINGEYVDSWTKFKFNNILDVDSKHHGITRIITFKNHLFFVQPTAVGVASVNARSLIQDNQPGELTLGTSGILTRKDYLTEKSGSEFYEGIVTSDDFLYYIDGKRKRINKLVPGKEEAISVVKGIDSLLDSKDFDSAVAGFDRGYNEVLFAIDYSTFAFSEAADAFISSYSFNPKLMFSIGSSFYTVSQFGQDDESPWLYEDQPESTVGYVGDSDEDEDWDFVVIGPGDEGYSEEIYQHNVGIPGSFYGGGGTQADSYITLIINPEGNNVCFFDNLDLRTESTTGGSDDPKDIFYRMEVKNTYQSIVRNLEFLMNQTDSTKGYKYNTGSISRLGRVWRTPIMGENATTELTTSNPRILDTFIILTLRYRNEGNKFKLHDITTYYRTSTH